MHIVPYTVILLHSLLMVLLFLVLPLVLDILKNTRLKRNLSVLFALYLEYFGHVILNPLVFASEDERNRSRRL